jgi:hypothetical protein
MSGWTEDRLAAAYRAMADKTAAHETMTSTLAALRAIPAQRPRTRDALVAAFGRHGSRLVGAGAAIAIVAVIAAGLVLRSTTGPTSGPTTEPGNQAEPATVDGLPVQTVSQALAAEKSGAIVGDSLVAIKGWYDPTFPFGCPAETPGPALVDTCASRKLFVSENPERLVEFQGNGVSGQQTPSGTYIAALEPDGSYVGSLLPVSDQSSPGSYDPSPVVIVGHFHDLRAANCGADQKAACDSAFVIDQLAWLDGKTLGPNVWIGYDSSGQILKPRLDEQGVMAALQASLDPGDVVVSMSAVGLVDLYSSQPGRGVSGGVGEGHPNIQWFVRIAGPQLRWPEMAFQGGLSGWVVAEDDTGQLGAVGGWGFVSAEDPTYVPAVRTLPSGALALPTTNQLAGGACAGVGVDAVLHGSAADPRIAWLTENLDPAAPARLDVVWPAGYRARFAPGLEILDENAKVVLQEGDRVTGLCSGVEGVPYLQPPFS